MEAYDTFYTNIFTCIFKNPGIEKLWGTLIAACKVLKKYGIQKQCIECNCMFKNETWELMKS